MNTIFKATLCLFTLIATFTNAFAEKFELGGINYEISSTNSSEVIVVSGNSKYKGNVTIPSEINYLGKTYSVISIGESAFKSCSELSSIALPNSVTTIEDYAFWFCSNLESVELSTSLTSIGSWVFSGTSKLKNISLPASLKSIKSNAFNNSGFKTIFIPENVVDIQGNVFVGCKDLSSIEVDENNKVYDSHDNCSAIIKSSTLISGCKSTTIPSDITTIGESAFESCSELVSIIIPNSVTAIEDNAFRFCSNLESVELSTSLTSIGSWVFSGTSKLYNIVLPSSVNEIKNYAFYNSGLRTIISEIYTPFSIDKSVFDDYNAHECYNNATLYVKEGRISIYQNTDGWKEFVNIQKIEPTLNYAISSRTTTISYSLNPMLKTGTIIGINSTDEHISIPAKITYSKDGEEYLINKINDRVLAHKDFVTITFPKQKQVLGSGMFEGSYKLSAIIWNREDSPSRELISTIENPNLLFYTSSMNAVPCNLSNTIINGVAENIILTDAPETNFYCPQQFTAKKITYTHKYTLETEKGVVQGWESIALPFDVQTYETANGEAKPYAIAKAGERRFWLRELTSGGFKEAEAIKANIPYIISMPNWEGYQDFYNIEGNVTFSSINVVIPKTNIQKVSFDNRTFWPCFSTLKSHSDIYVLNKEKIDNYAPGSSFMNNIRRANPFECYFTYPGNTETRAINISEMLGDANSIEKYSVNLDLKIENGTIYINCTHEGLLVIYSLSGQPIKKVNLLSGKNVINDLTKGVYVINGNKITIL
ncbi:MAG: leucine-rich repeat domain-containing protein [Prevotellaceae bacterium]|nr:leucine-rich repeat domain-containing protein [Candidatus Colivivens equi]